MKKKKYLSILFILLSTLVTSCSNKEETKLQSFMKEYKAHNGSKIVFASSDIEFSFFRENYERLLSKYSQDYYETFNKKDVVERNYIYFKGSINDNSLISESKTTNNFILKRDYNRYENYQLTTQKNEQIFYKDNTLFSTSNGITSIFNNTNDVYLDFSSLYINELTLLTADESLYSIIDKNHIRMFNQQYHPTRKIQVTYDYYFDDDYKITSIIKNFKFDYYLDYPSSMNATYCINTINNENIDCNINTDNATIYESNDKYSLSLKDYDSYLNDRLSIYG